MNVIGDIEPGDEATSTNKREILSKLSKYQQLGPDWLEQEGYEDPSGNNYKYVYVKKSRNRRLDTFNTIPLDHFKTIIKSVKRRHIGSNDDGGGEHDDEYDEEYYEEDMSASPSNTDNAYKHWADTQTAQNDQEDTIGEVMEYQQPVEDIFSEEVLTTRIVPRQRRRLTDLSETEYSGQIIQEKAEVIGEGTLHKHQNIERYENNINEDVSEHVNIIEKSKSVRPIIVPKQRKPTYNISNNEDIKDMKGEDGRADTNNDRKSIFLDSIETNDINEKHILDKNEDAEILKDQDAEKSKLTNNTKNSQDYSQFSLDDNELKNITNYIENNGMVENWTNDTTNQVHDESIVLEQRKHINKLPAMQGIDEIKQENMKNDTDISGIILDEKEKTEIFTNKEIKKPDENVMNSTDVIKFENRSKDNEKLENNTDTDKPTTTTSKNVVEDIRIPVYIESKQNRTEDTEGENLRKKEKSQNIVRLADILSLIQFTKEDASKS